MSGRFDTADAQSSVDAYFATTSSFWSDLYAGDDVYAVIHQQRQAIALDWVDGLGLAQGSAVLDIGCGAGLMSVALALRGFEVRATDTVIAMTRLTRRRATEAGVTDRLTVGLGDAHSLGFEDAAFDVVLALGVIPWLHSPGAALCEMSRVVRPGGAVIATADNRARLTYLLDPKLNPALAPVRSAAKGVLGERVGRDHDSAPSHLHTLEAFERLIEDAGLEKVQARTIGYGPFTLLGRPILPKRAGVRLHRRLQTAADRGAQRLRAVGSQYLVMARKP